MIKAQVSLIGWCHQGFFAIVIAIFPFLMLGLFCYWVLSTIKIGYLLSKFLIIQFSSFDYE